MKNVVVLLAIASIAILGFAPPTKSACTSCDTKVAKKAPAKDAKAAKATKKEGCGSCASHKEVKKETAKHECCGKDPFIMEANRMTAASEGKKSTGCACEDKANAKKAAAKKQAPKAKTAKPAKK